MVVEQFKLLLRLHKFLNLQCNRLKTKKYNENISRRVCFFRILQLLKNLLKCFELIDRFFDIILSIQCLLLHCYVPSLKLYQSKNLGFVCKS
jgi:hypothetical protein